MELVPCDRNDQLVVGGAGLIVCRIAKCPAVPVYKL